MKPVCGIPCENNCKSSKVQIILAFSDERRLPDFISKDINGRLSHKTRVATFKEYIDKTKGSMLKKQEGNMPKLKAFLQGRQSLR
jgi:hypothetical protein